MKVATLCIHQFKTDRTIKKVSLRTVSMRYQRCNSSRVSQFQDTSGQPKHAFMYDSGAKLTALGIHQLKADLTVQEVIPVNHQRYKKNKQRNPHSIKPRADSPYIRNRVACAFPIQFPVLSYPCHNVIQTRRMQENLGRF